MRLDVFRNKTFVIRKTLCGTSSMLAAMSTRRSSDLGTTTTTAAPVYPTIWRSDFLYVRWKMTPLTDISLSKDGFYCYHYLNCVHGFEYSVDVTDYAIYINVGQTVEKMCVL